MTLSERELREEAERLYERRLVVEYDERLLARANDERGGYPALSATLSLVSILLAHAQDLSDQLGAGLALDQYVPSVCAHCGQLGGH